MRDTEKGTGAVQLEAGGAAAEQENSNSSSRYTKPIDNMSGTVH